MICSRAADKRLQLGSEKYLTYEPDFWLGRLISLVPSPRLTPLHRRMRCDACSSTTVSVKMVFEPRGLR